MKQFLDVIDLGNGFKVSIIPHEVIEPNGAILYVNPEDYKAIKQQINNDKTIKATTKNLCQDATSESQIS